MGKNVINNLIEVPRDPLEGSFTGDPDLYQRALERVRQELLVARLEGGESLIPYGSHCPCYLCRAWREITG